MGRSKKSKPRRVRTVASWAAGLPPVTAVPTGLPLAGGGVEFALALVGAADVRPGEIEEFAERFRFVPGDQTARAADSQARWTIERSGAVTVSFLAEDGASQLELPPDPAVRRWAALALGSGGTVALLLLPDMPSAEVSEIGRRIGSGGRYWHLSVGYVAP
ncbi:hypothetical protein ABZS76_32655 [Streptomyces sp. NPDC005562]|uniref:hypothetical protein n=1 Tax=Streptomyces sp. NPDC005562 TaxID=3154890 RepID=UPI0033BDFDEC